jgi:hypothetical protein
MLTLSRDRVGRTLNDVAIGEHQVLPDADSGADCTTATFSDLETYGDTRESYETLYEAPPTLPVRKHSRAP